MDLKTTPLGRESEFPVGSDRSAESEDEAILEAIEVGNDDLEKGQNLNFRQLSSRTPLEVTTDQVGHEHDLETISTQASRASKAPIERIKTAQDWTGPDDPGNPHNWPQWKKALHIYPVALLAFAVTCGSSLITPATHEIQEHFHVSRTAAVLSLSLFVLGLGFGPAIAAPLSENFGRTIIYKTSPIIYSLFLVGAGFSNSFGGLLVCRVLAAAAGAPVLAVGSGTIVDLYLPKDRALPGTIYIIAPFLGPGIGPIIGGFAAQYKGYRWTQWCTIFIGILAFLCCLPMEETYKKVILQRRAKKYHLPPPAKPQISGFGYVKLILTMTVGRPIFMLCFEPVVLLFSTYTAFTFSVLFSFFAAYPYTFMTVYGFTISQYGLTFIGIVIGVILAAASIVLLDRVVYQKKYRKALAQGKTSLPPEERLYGGMIGAFGLPIGLFWFGWTARSSIHWISPVLAGIPFAFGNTSLFIATALYFADVYGPLNGASAMAANGILRYTLGAAFPLFTFQMYVTLGIDWATSLLGFISIALLPIPFVFYKFGPAFREKSRLSV